MRWNKSSWIWSVLVLFAFATIVILNSHQIKAAEFDPCFEDFQCDPGEACDLTTNECVTIPPSCTPNTCNDINYVCGSAPDGCGGTINCGTCGAGEICSTGECLADSNTCSDPSQIILRLSSTTNAHGELWDGAGNYPIEICYDEIFGQPGTGDRTCLGGTNEVLSLSATTNAHAEDPIQNNYADDVCYEGIECAAYSGTCPAGTEFVVGLSAATNAHLSISQGYPLSICCAIGSLPPPPGSECQLTDAYWSELSKTEGEFVNLIVEGTNCQDESISFEVWEDDLIDDDPVTTNPNNANFDLSGNIATGVWVAEWQPDASDPPEYYFEATLVSSGGQISSGTASVELLEVQQGPGTEGPDECETIVICDDYDDEVFCGGDPCNVAQFSVESIVDIDCDDPERECACWWNPNSPGPASCDTEWTGYDGDPSNPGTGVGTCRYEEQTQDTCEDDGFLTFSWTAEWIWAPGNEITQNDPEGLMLQCQPGQKTVECPAQIPLPFFGFYNFVITLALIGAIYFVLSLRKQR